MSDQWTENWTTDDSSYGPEREGPHFPVLGPPSLEELVLSAGTLGGVVALNIDGDLDVYHAVKRAAHAALWVVGRESKCVCEFDLTSPVCECCRYPIQPFDAEQSREVTQRILARAEQSPRYRRQKAEAERLWSKYESRKVTGPKPGVSPLPAPKKTA